MNPIAEFVKKNRKAAGLTQEQFAMRSGLGLRFVRELASDRGTVKSGSQLCGEYRTDDLSEQRSITDYQ